MQLYTRILQTERSICGLDIINYYFKYLTLVIVYMHYCCFSLTVIKYLKHGQCNEINKYIKKYTDFCGISIQHKNTLSLLLFFAGFPPLPEKVAAINTKVSR